MHLGIMCIYQRLDILIPVQLVLGKVMKELHGQGSVECFCFSSGSTVIGGGKEMFWT